MLLSLKKYDWLEGKAFQNEAFTEESLRRALIRMDKNIKANEAHLFWNYLRKLKIDSFEGLKKYAISLNLAKVRGVKFNKSLILILEKCLENGVNIR